MQLFRLILSVFLFTCSYYASAQLASGGLPISLSFENQGLFYKKAPANLDLSSLDRTKLRQDDDALNLHARFAAPITTDLPLQATDHWTTLKNGDRVWRTTIQLEDAYGIFLSYEKFYLPPGAKLWMYSPDGTQIKGAYTARNNTPNGKFLTGAIDGNVAIVEYYEPKAVAGQGRFRINKVYEVYKKTMGKKSDYPFQVYDGFGDALSCHVNVNCPTGNDYQEEKKSVLRMLRVFEEGMGYCTGSLINNVNEDQTPYVLSAYHCIDGLTPIYDLWRFSFNYESPDCSSPANSPMDYPLLGCQFRSGRQQSDFLLLELNDPIPSGFEPFFLGWNHSDTDIPTTSTIISHPQGDVKKISKDLNEATIQTSTIMWNNNVTTPANHHFRLDLDEGTLENGSSGSSLLNENGLIVGQLHGGNSDCAQFINFFGRFSISWDAGSDASSRLKDWLDPNGVVTNSLPSLNPPPPATASISGIISDPNGVVMSNVTVALSGDATMTTTTDAQGQYSFAGLAIDGTYTIDPMKDINPRNGVTPLDVVLTSKDLVFIAPLTELGRMAANVVPSNGVTISDIVASRRLQLFFTSEFSQVDSWEFIPGEITLENIQGDFIQRNFTGLKMGDVDFSANPNQ